MYSADSSDEEQRQRRRSRSHQRHKMPTYSGKERWEPFALKFERIMKDNRWSNRKTDYAAVCYCLVGDALEYADELPRTLGFTKLKNKLKERFNDKDVTLVARREQHCEKQEEIETLAEVALRIQTLSGDGFAHADNTTKNQVATEAFLKGCREKMAAQRPMERNPKTVHKALKYIKASVANQRALFGSRAPHNPSRQV
ncbi:hypothetical protein KP79_PYT10510 [Mizuhopecten yessoensis]|uniref:Uncharacterized protein n=1 Tax=Mizuhopecten yessoensis TaxID=6573 RepID=A0A210QXJ4_MIZYE|nr:hypothetical protein KP79_PYT10510 [Mizuhopecten yessoensis]